MFFFDMFQKRLIGQSAQNETSVDAKRKKPVKVNDSVVSKKESAGTRRLAAPKTSERTLPKINLIQPEVPGGGLSIVGDSIREIIFDPSGLGFRNYLARTYGVGSGVEDGCDERSLLIWSGYLLGILEVLATVRRVLSINISIYTLGGGFASQFKFSDPFDFIKIAGKLIEKPDFVLEISNELGHLEVLRIYLFDVGDDGLAAVRSNRAIVRKFPVRKLKDIYFSRKERWPTIDAVYTWVNHLDIGWQNLWRQEFSSEKLDTDRYAANDELRYSLRSLWKYAPWLRNIYIVSNCARPEWLTHHPRITWVGHDEIFPDAANLPTFNSHAIESCLHKIPDLAENFIYMNDDFVLNQPCLPGDFFDEAGRSISYLEPYGMVSRDLLPEGLPDYLTASINSKSLLKKVDKNYDARNLHRHYPYALKRSVLAQIEEIFPQDFSVVRMSKRRSASDINVTSFLYHHFALLMGVAVKGDALGLIVRPKNIDVLNGKTGYKYKLLCFNDGEGSSLDASYKSKTTKYLKQHLGEMAPWETSVR